MAGGQPADYPKNKGTKERYDTFCYAYHSNGQNGAEAAVEAGYAANSARQTATKMLTIPYIKEKLAELQQQKIDKYQNTAEDRLRVLDRVITEGFKLKGKGGNKYAHDLRAVIAAVQEQNRMLGLSGSGDTGQNIMPVPTADSVDSWEQAAQKHQKEILDV